MRRLSFYAALLPLILALACEQVWARGGTPEQISVNQAHALVKEQPVGLVIVDVRTPGEYMQGHLQGARNLDFTSPAFAEEAQRLPKDSTILLYCKSGARSARAADALQRAGFAIIRNMQGGMDEWQRAGLPVVTGTPRN